MKRKIIDELIKWKSEDTRKAVLLTGAKGVGKTYLAYDFAKAFFEHIYYINFEREPVNIRLFHSNGSGLNADDPGLRADASEPTGSSETVSGKLVEYFRITADIPPEGRLLILDEISFCPEAAVLLKEQRLQAEFPFIMAISSNPLPSDCTDHYKRLAVYPLEFDEFLLATGNEWYIEAIVNHFNSNTNIPEIVHKELLSLHQLYLQIGGMPAMINEYLNLSSAVNVAEQQSFLIGSYRDYIKRDNSDSDALKMNQVIDSLAHQLLKENKKFQYKIIRKGTTHAMYREAIGKLAGFNYIIRCNRVSTEQLAGSPDIISLHASDEDNTNFKLYLPDTGLLYSRLKEELGATETSSSVKALLENYVAQALQAKNYPFVFWESESMAKIDFIIAKDQELLPIEIHESDNTRSKSISVLKQKCDFPYAIKISSRNFEYTNQIKYVPYYAVFCL